MQKILKHQNIYDGVWYKNKFLIATKTGVWLYDFKDNFSSSELITNGDFYDHYKNESDIFTLVSSDTNDEIVVYGLRMMNLGFIDVENKIIIPLKKENDFYDSTGYYDIGEGIKISPDNKYLAASSECNFYLWDIKKNKLIKQIDELMVECWSKTENLLILVEEKEIGKADKILFYNPELDKITRSFSLENTDDCYIANVKVTNKLIIVALTNNTIVFLDYKTHEFIRKIELDFHPQIEISPDEKFLIVKSSKVAPILYDLVSFKEIFKFEITVRKIFFSPDSKQIALIKKDYVEFFEVEELIKKTITTTK